MNWMYVSEVWTHGCKSSFPKCSYIYKLWYGCELLKLSSFLWVFDHIIVNILHGHCLIFIHVEIDNKPCGLVTNCIVIGQSDKIHRRCCHFFFEKSDMIMISIDKKKDVYIKWRYLRTGTVTIWTSSTTFESPTSLLDTVLTCWHSEGHWYL